MKMLCHRGTVRSLAVDMTGRYMATCGADSQVKTWDVRMYKEIHSYYSAVPAVHVDISRSGACSASDTEDGFRSGTRP